MILPDFTSEQLGQAMQVLQFSQQDNKLFNGVSKDILDLLGVDVIDKYQLEEGSDGSESQQEMEKTKDKANPGRESERKMAPTYSVSENTLEEDTNHVNNYNEREKQYERDNDDVDDYTDQDIQNLLLMSNQNLSDSDSDEEEETVDQHEMYLGVQNFLLQDQDLNDTDSDSDEENIQKETTSEPSQVEEEESVGNISAKINAEIKNLLGKSAGGYICKVCGKTGRLRPTLTRHIETHLEGFSHPCSQCKAVMPTRNARDQHVRKKHRN